MALVERDLMDSGTVRVHHVQIERRLVAVLVLRFELRLALIEQHGLGLSLARGGEDDASVGHHVRADVVGRRRILVGRRIDCRPQLVTGDVIDPDAPRGSILLLHVRLQRAAHGKHDGLAIRGYIHVLDVVRVRSRDPGRDVGFRRAGRGGGTLEEVGLRERVAHHPQVVGVLGNRPLHVEDGVVDGGRIRRLAVGDGNAAPTAATFDTARNGQDSGADRQRANQCLAGRGRVRGQKASHATRGRRSDAAD